jgi:lysophospholipase L1-like esterase
MIKDHLKLVALSCLTAILTVSAIDAIVSPRVSLTTPSLSKAVHAKSYKKSDFPKIKAEHRIKEASWLKRYRSINALARTGQAEVVFLGDSITHGWKYTNTWNSKFGTYRAINAGISSDRVQHLLWRVENGNFAQIKPKVAVILVGVNNLALNTPLEIAGGIKQVTTAIHKRSPKTKILLLGIFPSGKEPTHKRRGKIKKINIQIKKIADNNKIHYLNFGNRFLEKDGSISKKTMFDYLHLTPKGYGIWASAMQPKLESLLNSH